MKRIIFLLGVFLICFMCFGFVFNFDGGQQSVKGLYVNTSAQTDSQAIDYGFIKQVYENNDIKKYYYNNEVVGEFFETTTENFDLDLFATKMGMVVLKRVFLDNTENIYAYSAQSPYKLKNQAFNMQISKTKNKIIVATPIIFGSF